MYQVIIVFHVLIGLAVIGLVLMQQGKGADAGAAFGSGASGTIFGARGSSSFLSRSTAICAAFFFATSLGLAVLGGKQTQSKDIMETPAEQSEVPAISGGEVPVMPSTDGQQPDNPQVQVPAAPSGNAEVPAAAEKTSPSPALKK
jgi:preprotein translocase subunit SecG